MDNKINNEEIEIVRHDWTAEREAEAGQPAPEGAIPPAAQSLPPRKKLPKWVLIIIIILVILGVLAAGAFIFLNSVIDNYAGKVNYTHDPYDPFDTGEIKIDTLPPDYYPDDETEEPAFTLTHEPTPVITLEPGATPSPTMPSTDTPASTLPPTPIPQPTSDVEEDAPLLMSDKVYNILIIGTDTRNQDTFRGNSDVMLLVSFNSVTKKIWLTSFHRDMYVQISRVGYNKLNSAYAYAGAKLLQKTLQEDFLVVAPYYVIVNFDSFAKVVDALGGIEITLTKEEANGSTVPGITEPGTYLLNGTQALNYARERRLSNDDFGRNQRHRNVVTAVINKFKKQGVTELMATMDVLLPMVTTNLPKDEIKSLIYKAPEYSKYGISELSIPISGTFRYDYYRRVTHVVIVTSMWKNIVAIRDKVYAGALENT